MIRILLKLLIDFLCLPLHILLQLCENLEKLFGNVEFHEDPTFLYSGQSDTSPVAISSSSCASNWSSTVCERGSFNEAFHANSAISASIYSASSIWSFSDSCFAASIATRSRALIILPHSNYACWSISLSLESGPESFLRGAERQLIYCLLSSNRGMSIPKKDDKRGQIPRMKDLAIADQNLLIQRWRLRNDLRAAYSEIVTTMVQWVIDSHDIAQFVTQGHHDQFHINPEQDLIIRMKANGFSNSEIQAAINNGAVAADWMQPELIASVIARIDAMGQYFETHNPGSFAEALRIYSLLGQIARRNFIQRYGYPPEQAPVPHVRITGETSEQKQLKPADHQPPLF